VRGRGRSEDRLIRARNNLDLVGEVGLDLDGLSPRGLELRHRLVLDVGGRAGALVDDGRVLNGKNQLPPGVGGADLRALDLEEVPFRRQDPKAVLPGAQRERSRFDGDEFARRWLRRGRRSHGGFHCGGTDFATCRSEEGERRRLGVLGSGEEMGKLGTEACAKRLEIKSAKERVHAIESNANETSLIKETA